MSEPKHKPKSTLKTERGRIMIFIDGSNLWYTCQMMNLEIDYVKLVDHLIGKDKLVRASFYSGMDKENLASSGWFYFMKRTGFRLVTKPLQVNADGSKKANLDVEMAVDMVSLADSFDTAIVLTGDGDLTYCLEHLMRCGKQVELVGSKLNTKDSLIFTADKFIELESLRPFIAKST